MTEEEYGVKAYARRYRPTNLDEYIGNAEMVTSLRDILKRANKGTINRPQSILLSGHTGCGKTTMARLLAKEYLCTEPGEDGSCGQCDNCQMVQEYISTGNTNNLYDIQEIDVTDRGGKNDVSEFVEAMGYPSQMGGWKVFILDECHLLTDAGASLLLKIVEEPPEDTLVIFCTTDPEKMLDTLKNRCQVKKYVKKPSLKDLSMYLGKVCELERVKWDKEGLRIISVTADFVIRNALNLLEQVVTSKGDARSESASAELGTVTDGVIFKFLKGYSNSSVSDMVQVIFEIKTSVGLSVFLDSLEAFITRGIYLINDIPVEGLSNSEIPGYVELFNKFNQEDLSRLLDYLVGLRRSRNLEVDLLDLTYRGRGKKEEGSPVTVLCNCQGGESLESNPKGQAMGTKFSEKDQLLKEERLIHSDSLKMEETKRIQEGLDYLGDSEGTVKLSSLLDSFPVHEAVKKIEI